VALEMENGCSTLVIQAIMASALIKGGMFRTVCCVCGTSWTKFADYTSRDGWILGDGAAALVLGPVESDRGVLGSYLKNVGQYWDVISIATCNPKGAPEQAERLLFRIADNEEAIAWYAESTPELVPDLVRNAASRACVGLDEIDFFISHQPNGKMPDAWARSLGFEGRHHVTVEKYGNLSGASAGVNLHEAISSGRIQKGDVVVMAAPGASTLHGAIVFRL